MEIRKKPRTARRKLVTMRMLVVILVGLFVGQIFGQFIGQTFGQVFGGAFSQAGAFTVKEVFAEGGAKKVCSELAGSDGVDESVLEAAGCSGPTGSNKSIAELINTIINVAISMVGIISVGALVVAGQRYIVSGGDPGKVASAKKMTTYAVVAIVVALLAFAIVKFVTSSIK